MRHYASPKTNFNNHKQKERKRGTNEKKKLPEKPSLKLDGKSNKKIKWEKSLNAGGTHTLTIACLGLGTK